VKIPPEIKWETPMAAQVIVAVHGDIKGIIIISPDVSAVLLLDWLYSPPKQTNK
jgi:hypothetical protein